VKNIDKFINILILLYGLSYNKLVLNFEFTAVKKKTLMELKSFEIEEITCGYSNYIIKNMIEGWVCLDGCDLVKNDTLVVLHLNKSRSESQCFGS